MNFFVKQPKIDPAEYLSSSDAKKTAGIRLNSPPSVWHDEVVQNLIREHPYIPPERAIVNFKKKDDAQGTAFGYVGIAGAPHISIPIIIRRRELAPLDVMVRRADDDTGTDQGIGDMTEDRVQPLTEETFEQALDTGSIGQPVTDRETQSTGYTEDGSALRLPFRGRTVIASVLGARPDQLKQFMDELAQNKEAQAGFILNGGSEAVVNAWLAAKPPVDQIRSKLASANISRASAKVLSGTLPQEFKSAEFNTGVVCLMSGVTKSAAAVNAVDLAEPFKGAQRYLVYEDGTYGRAPEKLAALPSNQNDATVVKSIFDKCATGALRQDMTVSFVLPDNVLTVPSKIASVTINGQQNTISLQMQDALARQYTILLTSAIKTAELDSLTKTWLIPMNSPVLSFGQFNEDAPMPIEKVAQEISRCFGDEIVCSGGQFTVTLNGDLLCSQCSEQKAASVLGLWVDNTDVLLGMAKETGHLRFQSGATDVINTVVKQASVFNRYPEQARKVAGMVAIPMKLAVKLAAAIGSPEGVDAILGAGFLNEDNLADFVGLADEFDDTVGKLARLLLAIRMGLPGDESATMVAMKALQRVGERLKSAVQEVGM